jgi:hypothetical protein
MKIDSRTLSRLARNPRLLHEFQRTGKLPESYSELLRSPLISLLESIYPRDRCRILGVQIGPSLGYSNHRRFHTASQALMWVKPAYSSNSPAKHSQLPHFRQQLTIDDLAQCCSTLPGRIIEDWWRRNQHLKHLRKGDLRN